MTRAFRGKTVSIEVQNPKGVCKGIKTLTVDGETVSGCIVPTEKIKDGSKIVAVLG
jgi:cellobiose phosphorylase